VKYIVPNIWNDNTCVILAGGPSLHTMNVNSIKTIPGLRYIAINDSWRLMPEARLYFCDAQWWTAQIAYNRRTRDNQTSFHDLIYKGFWITGAPGFETHPQVHSLKLTGERGLETDPGGLRHGSNAGYQAINLAVHYGAKRILLLGYDMRVVNGRTHWHDEQREPAGSFKTVLEKSMLPHFSSLVEPLADLGVEVVNVTPGSALTYFRQSTLESELAMKSSSVA
jgi:hypothetical protein